MIQWSHSALKQFEQCARQYAEIRVYKRVPREDNEQSIYGSELHAAAEAYGKGGELDQRFEFMRPYVDALLKRDGVAYFEHKMALDQRLEPCGWKDKHAWVRGIADVLVVNNRNRMAWCADYKTGSDKYADTDQLDLMSLLVFQHFPAVAHVSGALLFVLKERMVKHKVVWGQRDVLWQRYRERVAKIEGAVAAGVWNPTQSGLCKKNCPVLSCEFNGRHV